MASNRSMAWNSYILFFILRAVVNRLNRYGYYREKAESEIRAIKHWSLKKANSVPIIRQRDTRVFKCII